MLDYFSNVNRSLTRPCLIVMELLRTDTTFRLLGISRNGWVSMGAILAGAILFYIAQKRGGTYDVDPDVEAGAESEVATELE